MRNKQLEELSDRYLDPVKIKAEVDVDVAYQVLDRLCRCYTPNIPYIQAAHMEYSTPWDAICGYAQEFRLPVFSINSMIEVASGAVRPVSLAVSPEIAPVISQSAKRLRIAEPKEPQQRQKDKDPERGERERRR